MIKKIGILVISLLIITIFCSCNFSSIHDSQKELYLSNINLLPKNLVKHFPLCDSIDIDLENTIQTIGENVPIKFSFTVKYKDSIKYFYRKKVAEKTCTKILSVEDSNMFIVFSRIELPDIDTVFYPDYFDNSLVRMAEKRNLKNINSNIIIPVLEYDSKTITGLTDDYKIYFIESKKGKYMENKYYVKSNVQFMSDEWIHGYSRGYALNDKLMTIIYWVVVW